MALNPLAVSQSGVQVPGANSQPYPTLGPAQGGVGPGAEATDPSGGLGGGESDRDKVEEVVRLATVVGIQQPKDLMAFLAGLGFQTASRLAKPALPRGITDDPMSPQPPEAPPMPPSMGGAPMPPGPGM